MKRNPSKTQPPPREAPEPVDWQGTERYKVLRCIGRGGMGSVYEARDRDTRQRVALKTMLNFDAAALYQFKQEFRTLADVHHPNLVRLNELVATEGDRVFFSMELVRGTDFLAHVQKPRISVGVDDRSELVGVPASVVLPTGVQRTNSEPASVQMNGARRRPSPADFDRLRPALRQLVEGVHALHLAGKLHRDIKPSNVLVTSEGRVVLLDFGVAMELPRVADESYAEESQMVGTVRYMAPEQAFQEPPTPASDWYSVGVILYEALVGGPPFSGSNFHVIQTKTSADPPAPSECAEDVPEELNALCMALLDRSSEKRPTGLEILRRLGVVRASVPSSAFSAEGSASTLLVGRAPQMRALDEAFANTQTGRSTTVHISGQAGMGKSALLQQFLDGLVERGEAVVLRGRAYERESVPYKAFDAVVDALSRHLMHLGESEDTFELPAGMGALARLFPVLRRVPRVFVSEGPVVDPQRMRRRAFVALRELMTSLVGRRPLVVCVDDVQWGDTDSAALLLELVRPPSAPAVLFLLAHREEDAKAASFLTELRARWPAGAETREVSVGPLETEDARQLSLALIGTRDAAAETIADIAAREGGGSPLLVEELTRSSTGRLLAADNVEVTLEQIVVERLGRLPEDARRLAEIVAVGGRALPLSAVGDAAGIESIDDVVALLTSRRFVRAGLRDGHEVVEPVHGRIRETIVAVLSPSVVREYHGRLARVLEAMPGANPEAVAMHLLGAGETERGARFAERAAEQAADQLAFDQAARLLRSAIETFPTKSAKSVQLRARLGQMLEWAGRGEAAAATYLEAAEGVGSLRRIDFQRAAAEHLLACGRIDQGAETLHRVLTFVGIKIPGSPLHAIVLILVYSFWLRLTGLRFREREPEEVSPKVRIQIEALRAAVLGLAMIDVVTSACMQLRYIALCLRAGDGSDVLRALSLQSKRCTKRRYGAWA